MRFPLEIWDTDAERVAVLARAVDSRPGPMAIVDSIGNVVFLNREAEALWGEAPEALINRAIVSLLGLDERRTDADSFGAALESGGVWEGEVHPRRAGSKRRLAARQALLDPVAARARRKSERVIAAIVTLSAPKQRS